MRKLLVSLLLMLPLCGFAQKGMQGIGGGLGFGSCVEGEDVFAGISLKYQNHLTNRLRIVASWESLAGEVYKYGYIVDGYYYEGDYSRYIQVNNLGVSLNYFLKEDANRLRSYVAFGLSLGGCDFEDYDDYNEVINSGTNTSFGVNFGVGLDYRISYHFSMQAELMGLISNLMFDFNGEVLTIGPSIGLTYTF